MSMVEKPRIQASSKVMVDGWYDMILTVSSQSNPTVSKEYTRDNVTRQSVRIELLTKEDLFDLRTEIDKILLGLK